MFKAGSSDFCQIWLLVFVVNDLLCVNPEPFVEIRILDRVIRKMKVLHVYTTILDVSHSTNIPPIPQL
jgi:hypothetical protein